MPADTPQISPPASAPPMPDRLRTPPPFHSSAFRKFRDELPTIIDTFSPRPLSVDLSPTSSASSDCSSRSALDAFAATRSRVVRLYNLPPSPALFLAAVFAAGSPDALPAPITLWTVRDDYPGMHDSIWAVFRAHDEALLALALDGAMMSVAPALESDLEPFQKLRRFELKTHAPHFLHQTASPSPLLPPHMLRLSPSAPDFRQLPSFAVLEATFANNFTISSNPPNPRSSFRLGDWLCGSPSCAAHNFGRNLACIGCGSPRVNSAATPSAPSATAPTRLLASPRFASTPVFPAPSSPAYTAAPQSYRPAPISPPAAKPASTGAHPLLTPSGRAFASGGKVQDVSTDPLTPCVMYWPDNEPLPEQGQIRPSGIVGVPPPILNTGNRGPISHQPGDWICLKCNYLNWRRRKVCQTCFPYAEGNGDSISAAVQSERIALLTSVLAQGSPRGPSPPPAHSPRAHSLTPPHAARPIDIAPPAPRAHAPPQRSQSHFDLGAQYAAARPIYQTSGTHAAPLPRSSLPPPLQLHAPAPAPLLPAFLQDLVQSPALSPASSASADLEFDEGDDVPRAAHRVRTAASSDSLALSSIWRLDGDETKTLAGHAFARPREPLRI